MYKPAPFFRYPGGKTKLSGRIVGTLRARWTGGVGEYREPFFGGGGIGIRFLRDMPGVRKIWVNDRDPGIACLWTAVIKHPDMLIDRIRSYHPTVEDFYAIKARLMLDMPVPGAIADVVDYGFSKLVIHQISYSGLGTRAGGPIGGVSQGSDYPVDCRWSPDSLCGKIASLHRMFSTVEVRHGRCTCLDFGEVIEDDECRSLMYIDPPYYSKGDQLYQCKFSRGDHRRLRNRLIGTNHDWILSYDNEPIIRNLYSWACITPVDAVKYTINTGSSGDGKSRYNSELLISRVLGEGSPRKVVRLPVLSR